MKAVRATYATILNGLIHDLGAPVIIAAGQATDPYNDGTPQTLPTILNRDDVPDLTVVGGVDLDSDHINGNFEDEHTFVYGPSEKVTCASNKSSKYKEDEEGTSPATAMTAGLISYHMSMGMKGAEARAVVQQNAYIRRGTFDDRKSIYNNIGACS